MGFICDLSEGKRLMERNGDHIVISCLPLDTVKSTFNEFSILHLGEILSKELLKIDKSHRNLAVETTLRQILASNDKRELIITDIDILFNPAYRLDVIKLFIQLARNRKIIVQWPGEIDFQYLIYSTPEYEDYRRYSIKDYDIICLR
ncbi:hypothetical protein EDD65_1191 [Keratinibaculum paraultunense]|uniref:BREX-3 system P-loop-containing protein BrxF n=2 Tax=Keratinibaculum paraultunense TaxID=1278232 RepID=A0A4R3KMW8_9FIRM|nr:hypothetical protein EDD65_1191 [Keratinibaculum paraultunense]